MPGTAFPRLRHNLNCLEHCDTDQWSWGCNVNVLWLEFMEYNFLFPLRLIKMTSAFCYFYTVCTADNECEWQLHQMSLRLHPDHWLIVFSALGMSRDCLASRDSGCSVRAIPHSQVSRPASLLSWVCNLASYNTQIGQKTSLETSSDILETGIPQLTQQPQKARSVLRRMETHI